MTVRRSRLVAAVVIALVGAMALALTRASWRERDAVEGRDLPSTAPSSVEELRSAPRGEPEAERGDPMRSAAIAESRLASDGAVADPVLHCRLRDADGSTTPLVEGALVVRSHGALQLVAIERGEARVTGLAADAAIVSARASDVELDVLEAPAAPALGGVIVLAFVESVRLHVRDIVTSVELDGLSVHVREGSAPDLLAVGMFDDPERHGLPLGGSRVVAAGASPLALPDDFTSGHVWIESPTHGIHRAWIDADAARAVVRLAASGAIEASVPAEVRREDIDAAWNPREDAPGYQVICEPRLWPPWKLGPSGMSTRSGVAPGAYEAWLVPFGRDGPLAAVARANFDVVAGQTTRIDFRVLEASERAAGALRIVLRGGDPAGRVDVFARPLDDAPRWTLPVAVDAGRFAADAAGDRAVELADVRAGRWLVGDTLSRAHAEVVVPAGGVADLVLDLDAARRVDVEVVGGSTSTFLVVGEPSESRVHGGSVRVADGRATLHLVPGRVSVVAYDGGRRASATIDAAHVATLRLELPEARPRTWFTLELWSRGAPLVGASWLQLAIHDADGRPRHHSWQFPRGDDASYCRVDLDPGTYSVRFRDQTIAEFVAREGHPHVLVELADDAPVAALLRP